MAVKTETRELPDVRTIEVHGYGDVLLEQTPAAQDRVVIEAEEAILAHISSNVREGRLILKYDVPWWDFGYWFSWFFIPDKVIRYQISVKTVEGVSFHGSGSLEAGLIQAEKLHLGVSGSGKLQIEDVQVESLQTSISGSGSVRLAGRAGRHEIRFSGAGRMQAEELVTDQTNITISGSGSAKVNAEENLRVHISGAGFVQYKGQPNLTQQISGSGSVQPLSS